MILEDDDSYCDWYNSECKYEYNNAIVKKRNNIDANCDIDRTNKKISPSAAIKPNNNDDNDSDNGDNYNSKFDDDELFSSFLSSSFDDISKSLGRVLETTTIESCHNPFKFYCLPITTMSATTMTTNKNDNGNEEVKESQTYERVDSEEEETRPYVTFHLPSACEYCGCSSIHKYHMFGPNSLRPDTFFPKGKSPFVVAEQ